MPTRFGELGSGNEGYYLATAFDAIELQPVGLVGLTGIAIQVPLARDLLASLGIRIRGAAPGRVQDGAREPDRQRAHRRPTASSSRRCWTRSSGQLVDGIADGRKLAPDEVRAPDRPRAAHRRRGPGGWPGRRACATATRSLATALGRAGTGAPPCRWRPMPRRQRRQPRRPPRVALVRAAGLIRRGDGPLGSEIAADELAGALADIADDPRLRRRRAAARFAAAARRWPRRPSAARCSQVRAAGKPVIVSMGNAAASGGYWIAAGRRPDRGPAGHAHRLDRRRSPASRCSSEAWRKLGVNWAEISRGANADLWSINQPYSDAARARVDALVGWLYDRFTDLVAEGRDLPPDRVRRDRPRTRLGRARPRPSSAWSTSSAASTWRWQRSAAPCSCRPTRRWP